MECSRAWHPPPPAPISGPLSAPPRREAGHLPQACLSPPATRSSMLCRSSLRPLDIEFMKRLSKVVNIVPVIAKADTLTLEERVYFKQRVGLHLRWERPVMGGWTQQASFLLGRREPKGGGLC